METVISKVDSLLGLLKSRKGIHYKCDESCPPDCEIRKLKESRYNRPMVIDSGTGCIKIGLAGNQFPTMIIPNLICRNAEHTFVGDDAIGSVSRFPNMQQTRPVRRGIIRDFNDLKLLWEYGMHRVLYQRHRHLTVDALSNKDLAMIITYSPLSGRTEKKSMLKLLFENMGIGGVMLVNEARMTLQCSGRTTGVVLDVGNSLTYAVPIVDGVIQEHAICSIGMGGNDITNYMTTLLQQRYSVTFDDDKRGAEQVKKIYGYVAVDIDVERQMYEEVPVEDNFTLLSNRMIAIGPERFECVEPIFDGSLVGRPEFGGVQQLVVDAIEQCSIELRAALAQNIVLAGGTTTLEGFGGRMRKELTRILGDRMTVRVVSPGERQFGVWAGASVLAGGHLDVADPFWISSQEYFEKGFDNVAHKLL